ncbi:23S rRNA (uracil(1939)-C(5))-methyltransferase RlmD [Saccharicrinis sp. FJH54]|uniref:23S rRNA (uracil(1939)-C(5))-methyltransferase RlmD n=1 Tax=Saccharicrinis sp. FJH54 TaxID=3344665 RepID=UPI0035D4409D
MGRKKNHPLLENIEITDVGTEGKALARVDNMVVFTKNVVPGDIVDIQVNKKRKKYMEGFVTAIHKKSEIRAVPKCEHFGVCGGCKWQNLPYEEQLRYKTRHVKDSLVRIGHLSIPEVKPILGSEDEYYYRNKMEYTFCNNRWVTAEELEKGNEISDWRAAGFYVPGRFDKVLDLHTCHLQAEPSNAIRNGLKEFAVKKGYSFFDLKEQTGFLRTLWVRTSSTGEIMIIVVFNENRKNEIAEVMEYLKNTFPEITSLTYCINTKGNPVISDLDIETYSGKDHIMEEMEELQFKISPKSFYQTNSKQAYALYKVAREYAELTGNETVYDLYTGTGTIANFVASKAKKVIGIEYVEDAIRDARQNAQLNSIENAAFFAGDMKDILNPEFISVHGQPDVIITDPPRAGMHPDVVQTIMQARAKRIVYVSCNPTTQARDLEMMSELYRVSKVQPVDMFPHTAHVENVVQLELIDE